MSVWGWDRVVLIYNIYEMEWFWIYLDKGCYYTFQFEAEDLFEFTREMDDWFGKDISCVKLIMPYNEVDVAFLNALSWTDYPESNEIIKEFYDKISL